MQNNCTTCNDEIEDHRINDKLCFSCDFWYKKWLRFNDSNVVCIDGRYYTYPKAFVPNKRHLGKYTIKFHDDHIIATDSLKLEGDIPAVWQEAWLFDNAKFINNGKGEKQKCYVEESAVSL